MGAPSGQPLSLSSGAMTWLVEASSWQILDLIEQWMLLYRPGTNLGLAGAHKLRRLKGIEIRFAGYPTFGTHPTFSSSIQFLFRFTIAAALRESLSLAQRAANCAIL